MTITGKLEVFKNKRGYVSGILKAFEDNEMKGKAYQSDLKNHFGIMKKVLYKIVLGIQGR